MLDFYHKVLRISRKYENSGLNEKVNMYKAEINYFYATFVDYLNV